MNNMKKLVLNGGRCISVYEDADKGFGLKVTDGHRSVAVPIFLQEVVVLRDWCNGVLGTGDIDVPAAAAALGRVADRRNADGLRRRMGLLESLLDKHNASHRKRLESLEAYKTDALGALEELADARVDLTERIMALEASGGIDYNPLGTPPYFAPAFADASAGLEGRLESFVESSADDLNNRVMALEASIESGSAGRVNIIGKLQKIDARVRVLESDVSEITDRLNGE